MYYSSINTLLIFTDLLKYYYIFDSFGCINKIRTDFNLSDS